jgi:hypothetical protein
MWLAEHTIGVQQYTLVTQSSGHYSCSILLLDLATASLNCIYIGDLSGACFRRLQQFLQDGM